MRSWSGRAVAVRRAGLSGAAALFLHFACGAALAAQRSPVADAHYERGAHALRTGDAEAAVLELARAVAEAPDDVESLELYARALVLAGRFAKGVEVCERLRELEPASPEVPFLMGVALYRLEEWDRARLQLERVREIDPRNARARLLLGIVYERLAQLDAAERELREAATLDPALQGQVAYRLGVLASGARQRKEALRQFEEVIAQLPGSPLADSASARIRALRGAGEGPWTAYASAGALYDTNVTLAGQGSVFEISGENDYGAIFETGAATRALDTERFDLRVGARGFLTAYRDETDLSVESGLGWLEASYVFSDAARLEVLSESDYAWTDFDSFRRMFALEPAVRLAPSEAVLVRLFYRWEDRDFFTDEADPELDRDGKVVMPGADLYWLLPETGFGRNVARLGLRYRSEDSSGEEYESRGPLGLATLTVALPAELSLTLEGSYEHRRFSHPSIFELGGDRSDRITRLRLVLERPLSERVWLEGQYAFTHWGSNVDTYDFDRNLYLVRVGYRY